MYMRIEMTNRGRFIESMREISEQRLIELKKVEGDQEI